MNKINNNQSPKAMFSIMIETTYILPSMTSSCNIFYQKYIEHDDRNCFVTRFVYTWLMHGKNITRRSLLTGKRSTAHKQKITLRETRNE